jgi:hypothetical protein
MENKASLDSLRFSELEAKVKEMRNEVETVSEKKEGPWIIGKNYLIRTVTMTLTGTLYAVFPQELVLDKACWIPDTGRFMEATEKGEFSEVEPWMSADSKVIIGRGSIVDAAITTYTVSRKQK